jgi:membrane protease YdiL (CAAX protease family)
MKKSSLIALLLLVPMPSIGVLAAMYLWAGSPFGQTVFSLSKLWILLLPLLWIRLVDGKRWSLSKPKHGGLLVGIVSGLLISAVIVAVYVLVAGKMIDADALKKMAVEVGLSNVWIYLGATTYWVLINSVLEEYVWRWFVVEKLEEVVSGKLVAVLLSAAAFTLHHIIALLVYFSWPVVLICSAGLFMGGAIWSWFYMKYRSVWPGYLSHAIVDIAVFGIGYVLIFGGS